ncbi:hypothetical protein SAMN05421761_12116 [Belliella pelovolcani]|uniref:Uncharacterized protein n=1 Tax=Belliella pelovolcani TaxID=529505 RepID=A0A1N7PUY2_9BACT|nr:hypothetical protein SAMN05421761_12116 [Belliella pelovolcani]
MFMGIIKKAPLFFDLLILGARNQKVMFWPYLNVLLIVLMLKYILI